MSEIQNLLDADADNVKNCKQLFYDFSPELSQALEDCSQLYLTFFRILSKNFEDDRDHSIMGKSGNKKTVVEKELTEDVIWARRAKGVLVLLAYRSYMWAATDLYRTRITSSMNHLRQQIESSFYINLILNKPSVAKDWFDISTAKEGKSFFRRYSGELRFFLNRFHLADSYDRISGAASHCRLSSVMYGLEINSTDHEDRHVDKYKMKLQEIIQDRLGQFILNVLAFLGDQKKLFDVFLETLPEIDDPLFCETRIPLFKNKISRLFDLFNKKFPEMVKEISSKA